MESGMVGRQRWLSAMVGVVFAVAGVWSGPARAQGMGLGGYLSAATSDASVLVAASFRAGAPVAVFLRNRGTGWVRESLGVPNADTGAVWIDPKDGQVYVAYPGGASGMVVEERTVVGTQTVWVARDLVGEVNSQGGNVSTPIVGQFAVYVTPWGIGPADEGLVSLVGYNGSHQLVRFYQVRQGDQVLWRFANLTTDQFDPQGEATPQWQGSPVPYVTPWNGQNVAGLDANGAITAVWTAPALAGVWHATNLSQAYGDTPALAGGLSAYVNWRINLTGVLPGGELGVTWWSAQLEAERRAAGSTQYWAFSNLTSETDGPRLQPASVTGFTTPNWPSNNIFGLSEAGDLVVYWWAPGNRAQYGREWLVDNLNDRLAGSEAPVGRLMGFALKNSTFSILGTSASGDLLHFFWSPDEWRYENVQTCLADRTRCLPADDFAEYAGLYGGTYSGGESGTWSATIAADGRVTGTVLAPYGPLSASGVLSATGQLSLVAGSVESGAVFSGQATAAGSISGTWSNARAGLRGTFSGSRDGANGTSIREQEPNDDYEMPQPIPVPVTLTGTTIGDGEEIPWDEDFYGFTLASPRTVTITLSGGVTQDIDLYLGTFDGVEIAGSESGDANESVGPVNLSAGTYLIWVSPWTVTRSTSYTLTVR